MKALLTLLAVLLMAGTGLGTVATRSRANQTPDIMSLDQVPKSQPAVVTQRVATTDIAVTYSRPVARGRALFGSLVPYGQVWNPGANDATAVAFSRDVTVNGRRLPGGKYSVWAIPDPITWTLIFSKAADVFHTPYPGAARDALRLEIPAETGPHTEVLTFSFPAVEGKTTVLRLQWGTVMVSMTIVVP